MALSDQWIQQRGLVHNDTLPATYEGKETGEIYIWNDPDATGPWWLWSGPGWRIQDSTVTHLDGVPAVDGNDGDVAIDDSAAPYKWWKFRKFSNSEGRWVEQPIPIQSYSVITDPPAGISPTANNNDIGDVVIAVLDASASTLQSTGRWWKWTTGKNAGSWLPHTSILGPDNIILTGALAADQNPVVTGGASGDIFIADDNRWWRWYKEVTVADTPNLVRQVAYGCILNSIVPEELDGQPIINLGLDPTEVARDRVFFDNEPRPGEGTSPWIRAVVRHEGREQETIGENPRFKSDASLICQIFVSTGLRTSESDIDCISDRQYF